jgi:type IV secretion system protein VirB10
MQGAVAMANGRARSAMLANRANTVPQGTLIPAVLETAFDSTRPGFARAIVSRDVRGFDGSKVLIPRGSRLIGQYQSDASIGQKRAVITWTRLIRPDGAIIALDSPAVDPVGRGGVRASVNNHIPQRLFDALLQSTFQLGSALATRAVSGTVVVALPNSLQGAGGAPAPSATIVPTLQVPAATSISIFVVRDLEFDGETQQ